MKKLELLAPAGNIDALIGAINAGANAIYVGGKKFGARAFANNLSIEELIHFIEFAHEHNALLYTTINTVIFDEEISSFFEYTDQLVLNKVDAFIVQDIGLMRKLIEKYPDTPIHASTQVNTLSINQVKYLKNMGVKRIILARETSLDMIKEIIASVDIELEVFGHGALCVSYSGNCYLSSVNGERSGNRGECAQPCRLAYSMLKDNALFERQTYLLSTKDLMTLPEINEIIESNVDSLKIEGRMRKSDYVITAVKAYRKAIDEYYLAKPHLEMDADIVDLKKVFNRDFTKGYLLNEKPSSITQISRPNHMGVEIGKVLSYNWGKTEILLSGTLSKGDGIRIIGKHDIGDQVSKIIKNREIVNEAYENDVIIIDLPKAVDENDIVMKTMDIHLCESTIPYTLETYKSIPLWVQVTAHLNEPLKISLTDEVYQVEVLSDYLIEKAQSQASTIEKIMKQVDKFGQTPYFLSGQMTDIDEMIFIPNQVINDTRRKALELIVQKRTSRPDRTINDTSIVELEIIEDSGFNFAVKVETIDQFEAVLETDINIIIVPENMDLSSYQNLNKHIIYTLPRIKPSKYVTNDKSDVLIQDIGDFYYTANQTVWTDIYMNITNLYSLEELLKSNAKMVSLSVEMNFIQVKNLLALFEQIHHFYPPVMVLGYGRIDAMITKYCPISKAEELNISHCHICDKHDYTLVDPTGSEYPLKNDGDCNIRVLNHKVLNLIEFVPELKKNHVSIIRLDFTVETKEEVRAVINAFQNKMNNQYYQMPEMKYTHLRFRY
ncbi:MAG: U32 family peptidase [Candidatus Izemoplasmatales bacterium]|jgi:putative protease|nr:U32 family peptidase [Candidatus Izemoplasmatales bacterium]